MEELSIETNAPTEYGKYVDECLNEAAKHFFSEGKDKYSVADLFYAGVRCGESWLEKQDKQKSAWSEDDKIRKDLIAFLEDIFYFGKNTNLDKWDKSDCSDWIVWLEKKREKKQEWSEDDENEFNHIIHILNLAEEKQEIKGYNNLIGTIDWFKSLKDKVQSKQSNKPQGKPVLKTVDEKSTDNANNVQPKFKII